MVEVLYMQSNLTFLCCTQSVDILFYFSLTQPCYMIYHHYQYLGQGVTLKPEF